MKTIRLSILTSFALAFGLAQSQGAPGELDLSFNPGSFINGSIVAVALQGDGRVLIGGHFTTVHGAMRSSLARLNADGSVDETFLHGMAGPTNSVFDLWVSHIAVQADGKVLIGGAFTSINGLPRINIARLNSDGSVDASFHFSVAWNDWFNMIRLQPDGKILLAWSPGAGGGCNLARLNPDGARDGSFVAQVVGAWQGVQAVALQSDGKVVLAGATLGTGNIAIARLNTDGSADNSFSCQIASDWPWLNSISIQPDGRILIGGLFSGVNGTLRPMLARLNPDGSLDASFLLGLSGPNGQVRATALKSDGKLLILGDFTSVNGLAQTNISLLQADGSLDTTFSASTGPNDSASGPMLLQSDGKLVVGGYFTPPGGARRERLARLNPDGSVDTTFLNERTGPNGAVRVVAPAGGGKVLIGGAFTRVDGMPYCGLARLSGDGSLDSSFFGTSFEHAPAPWNPLVSSLDLQSDGKIVVGGQFTSINGVARTNMARLNGDGSLDTSFTTTAVLPNGDPNSMVLSLALQGDGKILVTGCFGFVNGVGRTNIARLNVDGSVDSSFNASLNNNGLAVVVQSDGRILIAGSFSTVNGVTRKALARLNRDGSLDNSFFPGLLDQGDSWVRLAGLQRDGRIIIAGFWQHYDIARLNTDGSMDVAFGDGYGTIASLALQNDDKVLIGYDSSNANRFRRLNANGGFDNSFLNGSLDGQISGIAVQPNGNILVSGDFTSFNQIPRSFVARVLSNGVPPAIRVPPGSQTAERGAAASFSVRADGSPPLQYLWIFNGASLFSTGTNSILQLSNIQLSQAGAYTAIVTNISGSVTSPPALLSVIAQVDRRMVPGLTLMGQPGSSLNLDSTAALGPAANWITFDHVPLTAASQWYFDVSSPWPPQGFYRAWQSGEGTPPVLDLHFIPALTLTGAIGNSLRVDYINQLGPIDAWVTLATVTLTNTTQLYFDTSVVGQPPRLYRILPVP